MSWEAVSGASADAAAPITHCEQHPGEADYDCQYLVQHQSGQVLGERRKRVRTGRGAALKLTSRHTYRQSVKPHAKPPKSRVAMKIMPSITTAAHATQR